MPPATLRRVGIRANKDGQVVGAAGMAANGTSASADISPFPGRPDYRLEPDDARADHAGPPASGPAPSVDGGLETVAAWWSRGTATRSLPTS